MLLLGGGAVVLLSAYARSVIRRTGLTLPMIAVAAGVLVGPAGAGLLRPDEWAVEPLRVLEQAARVVVALSLMHIAIHLPAGYLRRRWRAVAVLLFGGMLLMWGLSTLAAAATVGLFGDVGFLGLLLVAACVTPTDPVLAGTVVTGRAARRNIPARMRHLAYAESAANDGLAYPFVFLPLLLLADGGGGGAWGSWFGVVLPWQVGAATLVGLAVGWAAGKLQLLDERRGWSEGGDLTVVTLALTAFVLGAMAMLQTDAVLAVFAAGVGFRHVARDAMCDQEERVQRVVMDGAQLPTFVLLGVLLPWDRWAAWGWAGVGFAVLLLIVRRPPALLALWPVLRRTGRLRRGREAAFLGWFGPIGVAAVYYATLCERRLGEGGAFAWELVSLIVFVSVIVHGATAYPLTRLLGRSIGRSTGGESAR